MSSKLDKIYSWLHQNNLILNLDKSVFITFGNYSDSVPVELNISINGHFLKRVTNNKYLGITYDCNIKWDVHIKNIVNKSKYLVYVFWRLKKILSKNQLLQLYYGLFNSIAVYGIIGWGGIYETALQPLIKLQKRLLNTIGISDQDEKKPLDIRQIFVVNSIVYLYGQLKCEYNQNQNNTRYKSIVLPRHNLTIGQRSFIYYARKYFNKLPNFCKNLTVSKKTLKKTIKQQIKNSVVS